jgi:hypothetical protein
MSYGFAWTQRLDGQVVFAAHLNAVAASADSAFTAVEAAVATKGAITGQSWSGAHNFANGATAATPASAVSGNEVTTAAWVLAKLTSGTAENFGGYLYASAQINGGM